MSITISGVVRNGVIVPNSPLPEGASVEICMRDYQPEMPDEMRGELAAWQQASAEALALVERLAAAEGADEKG